MKSVAAKERTVEDQDRVDAAIAKLAVAFRVPVDETVLAAYADVLDDLSVEEVERECREWSRTGDQMPPAGLLRASAMTARRRGAQLALPQHRPLTNEQALEAIDRVRAALGPINVGKTMPGGK